VSYLQEYNARSQLKVNRRFGGTYRFHIQGKRITQERISMNILSRDWSVTIDGVWIDDRICLTPWYSAWLHFTVHCYTHTHTHTSVHSHDFTNRCSVTASNGGRCPFLWFPELSPCLSNSSQQLTTAVISLTHSTTNYSSLNSIQPTVMLLTSRHDRTENIFPLLLFRGRSLLTAVVQLFVSRSLPSNGSTCHNIASALLATCSVLASCLAYSSILKM
jgi:hypothetical protein